MTQILLHLLPASIYLGLVFAFHWTQGRSGLTRQHLRRALFLLALILHGASLAADIGDPAAPQFGFGIALSMTLWLALIFYWLQSWVSPVETLQVLALPAAAVAACLPLLFPSHHELPNAGSWTFRLHFAVAVLAYSLLTLAALHALLMAVAQRQLHSAQVSPKLAGLPPLLTLENLLFRMLWTGFAFLTLTVGSGIFFSEALFGKPLTFNHKTLFGLAAWLVFAALLTGRVAWGWRGRKALRLTLAGFVCLLFAYAGTRFVLEVVLGRP